MTAMTLYKYRAINDWALDALRSSQMWFSCPAKLNDTFEFSVPLFIPLSPKELVEHFETKFKVNCASVALLDAMMKHGGSPSFPISSPFFESFLLSNKENRCLYTIALIHFLREQGLSTTAIVQELNLENNNELKGQLESELRSAYDRNQAIGQDCGVLSLSGRYDDPLMWAHYADSCRGMCIGVRLDVDDLSKSDFLPVWVNYAEELPVLDASSFFDRDPGNVMKMLTVFYATKHTAWKHEAEFRLLSMKGDLAIDLPGRVIEVFLGEKVATSDARRVLDAVAGRSTIGFFKMMREPGTWKYRAYGIKI